MPAITAGLYRLDVRSAAGASFADIQNTFWYREPFGDNDLSEDLVSAFLEDIVPAWIACINTQTQLTEIIATPIFGLGVEFTQPLSGYIGTAPGTAGMAPYMCFSVRKNRSTNEVKNGWWRFNGLNEEGTVYDKFDPTRFGLYEDFADVLGDTISTLVTSNFVPVIVRPPGTYKTGEQTGYIAVDIVSCTAVDRVTTQNSRKSF